MHAVCLKGILLFLLLCFASYNLTNFQQEL